MVAQPIDAELQKQFKENLKNFSKLTKFQIGIYVKPNNLTASEEDL
jgi:hypothetical protein